MPYVTVEEVRDRLVRDGHGSTLSLELSREAYLQYQQFILDAQGTRRGRLDQDLERARCIYLHLPEPRFPTCYPPSPEGMRSASGGSRQWFVVPNASVVRAVLGGRGRPRLRIPGFVRPGPSSGELCIPCSDGSDLVFHTFGGAASELAGRLGYFPRRSGMLTFEMEWRAGQWVQLEALRPARIVRH